MSLDEEASPEQIAAHRQFRRSHPLTKMTIPEIIEALTPYTGRFPKGALEAAIEQKDAITPHLLRALEEVAEAPEKFVGKEHMLHMYATYLLAQFRDRRAYRPLTRILAAPGDIPDNLYGETVTGRIKNILASVYDGDPEPIKRLVEGDEIYEYVRGSAVGTFVVLAHTEQMPRQEVVDYFQSLFRGKLRHEFEQAWNELACAVADLPAPELLDDLRKAYEEGLVDPGYASFEQLERDAAVAFEDKAPWEREKSILVSDVISEMEWWAAFDEDTDAEQLGLFDDDPYEPLSPLPQSDLPMSPPVGYSPSVPIRSGPKIGRNDPCPCGSGKKYKKCCLAAR
jgi:hypothetical protein